MIFREETTCGATDTLCCLGGKASFFLIFFLFLLLQRLIYEPLLVFACQYARGNLSTAKQQLLDGFNDTSASPRLLREADVFVVDLGPRATHNEGMSD